MPNDKKLPELLAPAGDWECVRAAIENGADAVYFGLERFNARMRAKNFTQADLPELMQFLHKRGVRGYVTFNTLVFADELADAEDYLRCIISSGVDAAIVQDIGMCRMIRQISSDFPIHGSTQMTITSAAGVDFARTLGAHLVVLARENTIKDIQAINEEQAQAGRSLPLEVFVHGALCVAYSGQCLTSESLGGRSANRGECAQACRLPYELISDGAKVDLGDRRYLLSPQDLAGLQVLPELIGAGVASLKIEGRLKSPEYVANITRVYRQALDKISAELLGGSPRDAGKVSQELNVAHRYNLEMGFSRGLSTGWFRGINNQELAHARFGTKRGVLLGEVAEVRNESVTLALQAPLKAGDGVVFDAGRPDMKEEGGRVYQIASSGASVSLRFGRGDINWERVKAGQLLWKTNDPALDKEVRATFEGEKIRYRRPISVEVHGDKGLPLSIIVKDGEGNVVRVESSLLLEEAKNAPLDEEFLRAQLGRLGGTPFTLGDFAMRLDGAVMMPVSELNSMRRMLVAKLEALRSQPKRWEVRPEIKPPVFVADSASPAPEVTVVIRLIEQLEAAWQAGARTIYCEFEDPKRYRDAVARFRRLQETSGAAGSSIWLAPPRIFVPGEEWILKQVRSANADGYLVRNYDHLKFFAADRMRGDFSLNVANQWTADYFLRTYKLERVTASYDLNVQQLEAFLASGVGAWLDITIHQRMPLFHMAHCVFCAFLSEGKDYRDCGRPCDQHRVSLRDRVGAELPLKADAGCRNTVFNNRAQTGAEYVTRLTAGGARNFRVEFVNEPAEEVIQTVTSYRRLLRGEISGSELWREFKLINQLGVTRGQMDAPPRKVAGSPAAPAR